MSDEHGFSVENSRICGILKAKEKIRGFSESVHNSVFC
jgi:hypothetical protein